MDDFGTHTTTYIRDPLGRVESKLVGDGVLSQPQRDELAVGATQFVHDQGTNGIGRLTSVTLPFGSISMVYDAWGNLTDETRTIDLSNALGVTFTDTLTQHAEDFTSTRQPMEVKEASGITTITIPAYFGWRPFSVKAWHDESDFGSSYVTTFTNSYNAAGLVRSRRHFLRDNAPPYATHFGRLIYFNRDQNGRVVEEKSMDSSSSDDRIWLKYSFYGAGEVATLESRVGASSDERNYTFGYDHQHQLTNADDDKGYHASFSYSPAGRLQTADIDATVGPETLVWPRNVNYAYDSTDPEAVGQLDNASDPDRFADFVHDLNGNLTERTLDPDGSPQTFKLTYDAEDRLRVRELPDGKRELYYYHDNARWLAVKKDSVGTVLSARLWFGNAEIQYTCAAGTCSRSKKRTTLRLGGEAVARFERDVATGVQTERLLHSNRLGHLLGVYSFQDPTGALDYNLEVGYQYGPFGEILEVKEFPGATTSAEDYTERFNGKELDEASGLSHYGYRYYDPLSLTWNRSDPVYRFAPDSRLEDPRRTNLFGFVANNPVRYIDPDGLDIQKPDRKDKVALAFELINLRREPAPTSAREARAKVVGFLRKVEDAYGITPTTKNLSVDSRANLPTNKSTKTYAATDQVGVNVEVTVAAELLLSDDFTAHEAIDKAALTLEHEYEGHVPGRKEGVAVDPESLDFLENELRALSIERHGAEKIGVSEKLTKEIDERISDTKKQLTRIE
jgi:RHS repeat-associated protein